MKVKFNKNKKELIVAIVFCLFILNMMVWFVKGYAELIQDSSVGKLTFFSVIVIYFTFKLGNSLARGFEDIFIKDTTQNMKKVKSE